MSDDDKKALNKSLVELAEKGDEAGLKRALRFGADPLDRDSSALLEAAAKGHAGCVELLIPLSDPMADDSNALRWAASYGHAQCVELLIPVSDPLASASVALRWAAIEGHAECVALLLPVSDPEAIGPDGKSAASAARANGRAEVAGMIEAFIEATELSESCLGGAREAKRRATL